MKELQKRDDEARAIVKRITEEKTTEKMFILDNGVLHRLWLEERETFKCTFIPKVLREVFISAGTQQKWSQRRKENLHGPEEACIFGLGMRKEHVQTLQKLHRMCTSESRK